MEPRRTIGKFVVVGQAGRGSFGTVWAATREGEEGTFAVKEVKKEQLTEGVFQNLLREVSISKSLRHPNLSHCLFTMESKASFFMVFEFCQGGDLDRHLKAARRLPLPEALDIARQLRAGYQFLFDHGVLHRDLKPENILFVDKARTQVRISDFGSSKEAVFGSTVIGTPKYMAPEVFAAADRYDYRADLWSFVLIAWELFFGLDAFPFSLASRGALEADVRAFAGDRLRFPPGPLPPAARDFFVRGLALSPDARLPAADFFAHPFFALDAPGPAQAPAPAPASRAFRYLADRAAEAALCETAAQEALRWLPDPLDPDLAPALAAAALLLAHRAVRRCEGVVASLADGTNVFALDDFAGVAARPDAPAMLATVRELAAALAVLTADATARLSACPESPLRAAATDALLTAPSSDARRALLPLLADAAETAGPKLLPEDRLPAFRALFRRVLGLAGAKAKPK